MTSVTRYFKRQIELRLKELKENEVFPFVDNGVFYLLKEMCHRDTGQLFRIAAEYLYWYAPYDSERVSRCLDLFIRLCEGEGYRAKEEARREGIEDFYRFVSLAYPVHLSSLSSSPYVFDRFMYETGFSSGLQDEFLRSGFKPIHLLFIDEAGMALPHLAFPAIYWSRHVVCVGDPLQLPPVVPLDDGAIDVFHKTFYPESPDFCSRFSPALTTVYHRSAGCERSIPEHLDIGQAVFLDYHRRCQPPIANLFCKIAGYRKLTMATPKLTEERERRLKNLGGKNLIFCDVKGMRGQRRNTNFEEAMVIKEICARLKEAGFRLEDEVGVITLTSIKRFFWPEC